MKDAAGANGTVRFPSVSPDTVAINVVYGSQAGNGYGYDYDIANGEATMTITLYTAVQRTFTIVYEDGTGEKPAANINAMVFSEGGHASASGMTRAQGVVTLSLRDGLSFYSYHTGITVDGTQYSIDGDSASIDVIPAKWISLESSGTPYE